MIRAYGRDSGGAATKYPHFDVDLEGIESGDWTVTRTENSLGLLRSRSDPVGEKFVHRQPPRAISPLGHPVTRGVKLLKPVL